MLNWGTGTGVKAKPAKADGETGIDADTFGESVQ